MEEYEKKAAMVKSVDEYSFIPEGMTMKPLSKKQKVIQFLLGPIFKAVRFVL